MMLVASAPASASKQVVDFFGGQGTIGGQFLDAAGVAVNYSGAGGVPVGTFYVTDGGDFSSGDARGNRVQRFGRDDSGTPADAGDDTYRFVSAWGAGVQSGGTDYEICTVAADCRSAAGIGGNGTLAGDGALSKPSGIAVDQDTGQVYVVDNSDRRTPDGNFRINVYSATGAFLRSFGFDVVASGPDDNGTGYEVCKAGLDICKAGLRGAGVGQIGATSTWSGTAENIAASPPDGNPASGAVFLADPFNQRINTYNLDGSSPSSIGSAATFDPYQPRPIAIDSRGILYASNNNYEIERYDTQNANGSGVGFLAPIAAGKDEVQKVTIAASAGSFRLSFGADTTTDLPFNLKPRDEAGSNTPGVIDSVEEALEALPSIGANNVSVEGGPGNAAGSSPYTVTFRRALSAKDVSQLVASGGATPLSGGAGASVTTTTPGQSGLAIAGTDGLAVDPDTDGAGSDTDVLYVLRGNIVQQFGPANPPGLTAPPTAVDDTHGAIYSYNGPQGLAVEPPTGRLYVAVSYGYVENNPFARGVLVYDTAGGTPTASLDSLSDPTATTATVHATVNPNGRPLVSYRLEYVTQADFAAGGWAKARSTASAPVGTQETPQPVTALLDPPGAGLDPVTLYHVRLVATKVFNPPVITSEATFTTLAAPPRVETTGAPIRTATTTQLTGRVTPRGTATTYHFEYVTDAAFKAGGFSDLSSGGSTTPRPAGPGQLIRLVSEQITGLNPDTTYHYRLLADNGTAGSPVAGDDMTTTTRASDAPLSHGDFPGPPGSDRAYEQVSTPDTSGNPVTGAVGFSDDGDRALYQVAGGTPESNTGTAFNFLFAERPSGAHPQSGWQSLDITPPRSELGGSYFQNVMGSDDLSVVYAESAGFGQLSSSIFRMSPTSPATMLYEAPFNSNGFSIWAERAVSEDGSRVVAALNEGSHDPDYPAAAGHQLYDISTPGDPQLTSILPDGSPCSGADQIFITSHSVSPDGSLVFLSCDGGLYVRDLVVGQTRLIASGGVGFLKLTPDSVFYHSGNGHLYRYDLAAETSECVTCAVPALDGVVGGDSSHIAVAADGSRIYFRSANPLLPGAAPNAIYRLDVASGDLAYVADIGAADVGERGQYTQAITHDGSVIIFGSSDPGVNALGGQQNGGTFQYYRYDDTDRSLTCVSCPPDGGSPLAGVPATITDGGANVTPLSAGGDFAFTTATPLLGADQNTPGPGEDPDRGADVYEWRDGRLLLVTDGLTDSPLGSLSAPDVQGMSPSGRDLFFTASAQLTPDALEASQRLYDARIGGGIDFPVPPPPCPLEVCQGTPKGAPEDPFPASATISGRGNVAESPPARKCPRGKRKVRRAGKVRCVAKKHKRANKHRRANRDRRAHR